jgi:hypothetical protein
VKGLFFGELMEKAVEAVRARKKPERIDFCSGPVHRSIHAIVHLIEDHAQNQGIPTRFAATKLVEGDEPMLMGFGCTVPAVMATRTLSSERDKKMTILLTPFMSCSAKLPIYALFTAAFFPKYQAIVIRHFLCHTLSDRFYKYL